MSELQIPYASKNLIGTCFCPCCNQLLISAAEAAINAEMEEADYKDPFRTYLFN